MSIPVLSFADWPTDPAAGTDLRDGFVRRLAEVCHHIGFLQLEDAVDTAMLDRYFAVVEAFFALPDEVKAQIDKRNSPWFRGWERVGAELTDGRVDYREQLDLSTEHPPRPRGAAPAYVRLDGPNQWPPESVLPGFRAAVQEFVDRMGAIAGELMAAMALGLGLDAGYFAGRFGERPLSFVKLISYPPTPPGEAGVNVHHDAGFLTLLVQHRVGGLQAQGPDGAWLDVPVRRGAIVVNLGEMLQSMTGNYYVATTHRVVAAEARLSSAYFHGPDLRASLAPAELDPAIVAAVAASPRHAGAGFMARRADLLAGRQGTHAASASTFGSAV